MQDCNNSEIYIDFKGTQVKFTTHLTFNQADKKVIKEICGCNGSYCYFCYIDKELASNPDVIRKGFDVEKTIEDIIAKANDLMAKGRLNSRYPSKLRWGITHLPLETGLLKSNHILPPLHAKLNLLNVVLEILYIFNVRHVFDNNWPLMDSEARNRTFKQRLAIKLSETELQYNAKQKPLNLLLGHHVIGSGGTSNTGVVKIELILYYSQFF